MWVLLSSRYTALGQNFRQSWLLSSQNQYSQWVTFSAENGFCGWYNSKFSFTTPKKGWFFSFFDHLIRFMTGRNALVKHCPQHQKHSQQIPCRFHRNCVTILISCCCSSEATTVVAVVAVVDILLRRPDNSVANKPRRTRYQHSHKLPTLLVVDAKEREEKLNRYELMWWRRSTGFIIWPRWPIFSSLLSCIATLHQNMNNV